MGQAPFLEQRAKQEREKAWRSKQQVEQESQEAEASSTMEEARYDGVGRGVHSHDDCQGFRRVGGESLASAWY